MRKGFKSYKTFRRVACSVFALLVAVSLPVQAFAADFNVSNSDEMSSAWDTANANSDSKNSFYLQNDVTMEQSLQTKGGKTYDIYSAPGTDHTISEVKIQGPSSGDSRVNIHTDVTGQDAAALTVLGNTEVRVDGDVTTTSETTKTGNHVAVEAANGAEIQIRGDVNAAEAGIYANKGEIIVTGDVTLEHEGDQYLNHVIDATNGGNVRVQGDVVSHEIGILAMENSSVVVDGDVVLDVSGEVDVNNSVISASGDSKVVVRHDVTTDAGGISTNDASVQVAGDVVMLTEEDNAVAIGANNKSQITVKGDVISASNGVEATLNSNVEINGALLVEDSAMHVDKSNLIVRGDVDSGADSTITNNSDVDVFGDFTLEAENVGQVTDLYVANNSSLYLSNSKTLKADTVVVTGNSEVDTAFIKADYVSVGAASNNPKDTSKLQTFIETNTSGIANLEAGGSSTSIIRGDVGNVLAKDNAYVEVWLDAENVVREDNARVLTNVAKTQQTNYLPAPDGDDYEVGNTSAHTIINLCQSYTTGSTLQKQYSEMHSLLADVSRDIADELNAGSALWTSVFDHEKINTSSYLSSRSQYQDFYHNDHYNVDSKLAFMKEDNLNTYLVETFKDNLAQSLADISSSEQKQSMAGSEEVELMAKIYAFTKDVGEVTTELFSKEEQEFLKNAMKSGDKLTSTEIANFLRKFGYFNDKNVLLTAQRISRSYDKIAPVMESAEFLGKLAKAGVTVVDYAKYYMTDYTNQMIVLDEILANQTLSPEMYAAAAELRATMEDKMLGTVEKTVDEIKSWAVGAVKDLAYAPLAVGQAALDLAGLITGGTKDAEDLQNGAALAIMAPQLLTTFENAVENVRNGDTSEEALRMVYMSYTMVQTTLGNMCDIMTNIGDRQQEEAYRVVMQKLEAMKLGELTDLTP